MKSETIKKILNIALGVLLVAGVLLFTVSLGLNTYKALSTKGSIESFEVERGANSLTCVTAWVGTQPQMSCLPTQWMEAEVVYEEAEAQIVPEHDFQYPDCGEGVPPQDACWTKNGNLFPGYVVQ